MVEQLVDPIHKHAPNSFSDTITSQLFAPHRFQVVRELYPQVFTSPNVKLSTLSRLRDGALAVQHVYRVHSHCAILQAQLVIDYLSDLNKPLPKGVPTTVIAGKRKQPDSAPQPQTTPPNQPQQPPHQPQLEPRLCTTTLWSLRSSEWLTQAVH